MPCAVMQRQPATYASSAQSFPIELWRSFTTSKSIKRLWHNVLHGKVTPALYAVACLFGGRDMFHDLPNAGRQGYQLKIVCVYSFVWLGYTVITRI